MTAETPHSQNAAQLRAEALNWVARLASGSATRADGDALSVWRSQSEAHEAAFTTARRLWRDIGAAATAQAVLAPSAAPRRARPGGVAPPVSRRRLLTGAAAAGAAASAAFVVAQTSLLGGEAYAAEFETAVGVRRTVHPEPGLEITLNSRTRLVQPTAGRRSFELLTGEAAISVAAEPVSCRVGDVVASGRDASFVLRRIGDELSAACLRGGLLLARGDERVRLGPAQQVAWTADGFEVSEPIDLRIVDAWRRGLLVFRDRPLPSVVEELNRYSPRRIVVVGDRLRSRRISGVFHLDRVSDVLRHIEVALGASVTRLPGVIVLR